MSGSDRAEQIRSVSERLRTTDDLYKYGKHWSEKSLHGMFLGGLFVNIFSSLFTKFTICRSLNHKRNVEDAVQLIFFFSSFFRMGGCAV